MGTGRMDCPNESQPITIFTYKPPSYKSGPLFVVFHGGGRDAEDCRNSAVAMAERFGAIIVVPFFDMERFPNKLYQFGGIVGADAKARPPETWTFAVVSKIVRYVRNIEKAPRLAYYLIGHSAGGQFLVRLAAFLPGDAVRIVAANPGSGLFPTREHEFGYGFGKLPPELSNDEVLRTYLAAPLTLYLGTADIYHRPSFDASPSAMKQGDSRLVRGRACFAFAEQVARNRNWEFNWRKVETPGVGHDEAAMFNSKEIEDALFGK